MAYINPSIGALLPNGSVVGYGEQGYPQMGSLDFSGSLGIGGQVNRAGYDPFSGQFQGSNADLIAGGSYAAGPNGSLYSTGGMMGTNPQGFAGGTYSGWQNRMAQQQYGQPGAITGPNMMGTVGPQGPQTMPGVFGSPGFASGPAGVGGPAPGTANSAPYTPPPAAPGSATATNPFLNLGLNAFSQTQQPFDPSYLNNVAKSLYDQSNYNLKTNVFPGMDSNAILAGGYGGERTSISKGVAADRAGQNVVNAMAPQYAAAYQSSLDRALQGGNAAAGVGTNLENLNLNTQLGLGGLQNQTRQLDANILNNAGDLALREMLGLGGLNYQNRALDANITNNAGDLALREMLGLGGLQNQRLSIDNDTARVAQSGAGVPTYTNPLAAGIGGAVGIGTLLNLLYGNQSTTTKNP